MDDRAIPENHGRLEREGNYVMGCFEKANSSGLMVFGVQNGGECWTSRDAENTYMKYGSSEVCSDGTGGKMANSVYMITSELLKMAKAYIS